MVKNIVFCLGIFLGYISFYFIPSVYFYPIPFIIFFLFSKNYFDDLSKALFVTVTFAIPYPWGGLDSSSRLSLIGVLFSFPGLILFLSIFSLKKNLTDKISVAGLFLILFFAWGLISFIQFNPTQEKLFGIVKLGLSVNYYYTALLFLLDKNIKKVVWFILFTFVIFEASITILQMFVGHPLGLFIEESINLYPFGKLSSEDVTIFRPSGTMLEPTYLARFFTMLLPFVLLKLQNIFPVNTKTRFILTLMLLFTIFVTFTRVSWAVACVILLICFFQNKYRFKLVFPNKPFFLLLILLTLTLSIFGILPSIERRISTSSTSFTEGGSFDIRMKLAQEAINLIQQYPLFGVGLNQFMTFAQENNITGFFQNWITPVHNVPLLIASEMGIPALMFFILFVVSCYKNYFKKRKIIIDDNQKNFLDAAALGGLAYILEGMMGTIFLSPHLLLFFLYMAIISS